MRVSGISKKYIIGIQLSNEVTLGKLSGVRAVKEDEKRVQREKFSQKLISPGGFRNKKCTRLVLGLQICVDIWLYGCVFPIQSPEAKVSLGQQFERDICVINIQSGYSST